MNDEQKVFIRELRSNPIFQEICREIETHIPVLRYRDGKTEAQWAADARYGEGIDFVLKRLGYDNGR